MEKVTLVRQGRQGSTLRPIGIEELVEDIRSRKYLKEVNTLRELYPLMQLDRMEDGSVEGADNFTRAVPRVCFASLLKNQNRQRVSLGYTGLVLLEVNNLQSYEEAAAIRQGAANMPQTVMAFVGASGHSVKIVCKGQALESEKGEKIKELKNKGNKGDDGLKTDGNADLLPPSSFLLPPEKNLQFHVTLYEKARMAYNAQLGVTVEKLEPGLERTCYVSADDGVVYNPLAIPFYIDLTEEPRNVKPWTTKEPEELAPGLDRYISLHHIYEFNLTKAYDDMSTEGIAVADDVETYTHLLAERLADYCQLTGVPMSVALRLTSFRRPFRLFMPMVRKVFENAYRMDSEHKYHERKNTPRPLKTVPPETLMTMKMDLFLRDNYELRMNVMRGVAEYRRRSGLGFEFQDLTEQARNSITLRALEQGIKCWDKDIRRYVNSSDIEPYDPISDFLEHLPRWDGRDRVEPLARRLKTDYEEWPHMFHIWMRSMVAMWLGKGQLTGNALVPLLIGRQGCGKSSFCRILLPRDQRDYYNDRISFRNEQDLNLGLTSFALINLDEFDKISERQQVVLKYLLSTSDLKYRPPYGKAYEQHRRYASFIATTNEPTPLTDPTGSRRFVCVNVEGAIDFRTPVEYAQLYAQLKQEIRDGERYWLTPDEEQALQRHNRQYQQLNGLGEMFLSLFRRPEPDEQGQWLSLKDISARLKQVYRSGYTESPGTLRRLGAFMNRAEYRFDSRRRNTGMEYYVVATE